MMPYTAVDLALLESEWAVDRGTPFTACPVCCGAYGAHGPGCAMDQALSERGFTTQEARDRAREAIGRAKAMTEPPPAP